MRVVDPNRHELHCAQCGYDLRGLDERGRCPECGTSIVWTKAQYSHQRINSRYYFTKRLAIIGASLYAFMFVVWGVGSWGEASETPVFLYPFKVLFDVFGIRSIGHVGGIILVYYIGAPLFYGALGAVVGLIIDCKSRRSTSDK